MQTRDMMGGGASLEPSSSSLWLLAKEGVNYLSMEKLLLISRSG